MKNLNELVFYESTENIKSLCQSIGAREPNTSHAQEISSTLAQGRLFLENARSAPLEISPLLLFYSQQSFARAIVMVRTGARLANLPNSHGLSSAQPEQGQLGDLTMFGARFEQNGTAARFNDAISIIQVMPLRRPGDRGNRDIVAQTAGSNQLAGATVTLRDVLARMSDLRDLYKSTFDELPCVAGSSYPQYDNADPTNDEDVDFAHARISVRIEGTYQDLAGLRDILSRAEELFPRIRNWRPVYANVSYGGTYLTYLNVERPDGEIIDGQFFNAESTDKYWRLPTTALANSPPKNLTELAVPYAGTYEPERKAIIAPIGDLDVAEQTLIYVGLFVLSSITRYHPNNWIRAIRGGYAPNAPPNDKAIALIRQFLADITENIPGAVVGQLSAPGCADES